MTNKYGETIGSLLSKEYTDSCPILPPFLNASNLVLLFAPTGIGKTFFALYLAHAVATGTRFLKWTAPREVKVCYFDGEMGCKAMNSRLSGIDRNAALSVRGDAIRIVSFDHFGDLIPNLADPQAQKIYTEASEDSDLIIIDNLLTCSRPMDRWDDDFKRWDRIQSWAIQMRNAGKSVLFIHHTGKSQDQLGTSTRETVMDTVISIRKPKRQKEIEGFEAEIHFVKHRNFFGADASPIYCEYRFTPEGSVWDWSELREQKHWDILKLRNEGASEREIATRLSMDLFEVKKILKAKTEEKEKQTKGDYHDRDYDNELF